MKKKESIFFPSSSHEIDRFASPMSFLFRDLTLPAGVKISL